MSTEFLSMLEGIESKMLGWHGCDAGNIIHHGYVVKSPELLSKINNFHLQHPPWITGSSARRIHTMALRYLRSPDRGRILWIDAI